MTDVEKGQTVSIYSGDNCDGSFTGSAVVGAGETSVEVTISPLNDTSNLSYSAKVTNAVDNESDCANNLASYQVTLPGP
mgnify:CR=1 FL=1